MAVMTEFYGVFAAGSGGPFGTEAIPLDALLVFAILALLGAGVFAATRYKILQPPEMLCVLYVLLLAAPLLTTGFWRFMLASSATIIKEEDWEHYDSLSPLLWPHANDLLAGRLEDPHAAGMRSRGNVRWEKLTVAPGQTHMMPVLENTAATAITSLSYRLPVTQNGTVLRLLQGLLQREDGHGSCIPGQRHHRDNYPMEADWSPHDKAGRAFHSLSGALEREHGSCECQRRSPLHLPWAGELFFPILYAFDSRYFV